MNNSPLVSICCVTYNHAPFIRQCLDGFLMQKLQAPSNSRAPSDSPKGGENGKYSVPSGEGREGAEWSFEILIHDDCSTDGTTEIVREYQAKYPDLIFPLYETENQFCKPGRESMDFYNFRRARGKYIATCEGDDYWTDPLKLQKQVDFMEANPEYSVCFTGFTNHVVQTDEYLDSKTNALLNAIGDKDGMDIDTKRYFSGWYTQQLTMMFRLSMFSYEWSKQYKYYRDTHEMYHLIKAGKCRLLNFNSGVYNIHKSGINSGISRLTSYIEMRTYVTDLYLRNKKDEDLCAYLQHVLVWILNEYRGLHMKSTYWKTIDKILHDTPELFFSIIWVQIKQSFRRACNC